MPRPPAKRHVLAEIRIQCGLTQPELAKILGCASITVQKIEQGNLSLSEDLARRAETELGIAARYLLANDPQQKPVTLRGGLWTKEHYEFAQGASRFSIDKGVLWRVGPHPDEGAIEEFTALKLADWTSKIHAMLEATKSTRRQGILSHRLNKAINALLEDFKPDPTTLAQYAPKLKRLQAAYDKETDRLAKEEMERQWRET
jgi:transcriptional regulator with XRE-family HTH domain